MIIKGFKASAVEAAMRYKDRFDLGLIVAEHPCAWAGVFTQNVCCAAPVIWSKAKAAKGYGRAFLANAGQANAQTGALGDEHCFKIAQSLSAIIECQPDEIMLASTGVIGQPINMDALLGALAGLRKKLSPNSLGDFAESIMTTDTVLKTAQKEISIGGVPVNIWGCAKGSGMIAPNMATMLAFMLTDAKISPELLHQILQNGAESTFNRVTVDGDTSTNDSLMMMASGDSGAPEIKDGADLDSFRKASNEIMASLARQVAKDGEGATKLIEIVLCGAASLEEAKKAVRTVAESPLVKTAFFGCDANWGRICAALGRSGAKFNPYAVDIDLNDVPWIRKGVDNGKEKEASQVMQLQEYTLRINLNAGSFAYNMLTCDFSHEYVTINGSYRS